MGDFDRNPTPQTANQTRQLVIVSALGVVLIAVLGYHFMKPGPTPAYAGVVAPGLAGPAPVPDESADEARNALKVDPARDLLKGSGADDRAFDTVPHNPFVMSDTWRSALIRPAGVPTTVKPEDTGSRTTRNVPTAVASEKFKLNSIIRTGSRLSAIINDHIVTTGMVIDEARVLEIRETGVILQNSQYPDGPTTELTIDPKRK